MNRKFWQGLVAGLGIAVALMILVFGSYLMIEAISKKSDAEEEKKKATYISIDTANASDGRNSSGLPYVEDTRNSGTDKQNSASGDSNQNVDAAEAEKKAAEESAEAKLFEDKLNYMLKTIKQHYYNDVDDSVMYEAMLRGLVNSLDDPYSCYFSPKELSALLETTSGEYYGIGAVVSQNYETMVMTIVYPMVDSPAYEVGLLPGDIIVAVNGENVEGQDLNNVVAIMKGPEGTTVDLTVRRDEQEITVNITRRKIEMTFVSYKMLDDNIGYIIVSEFYEKTAEQLISAISDLEAQGMQRLIIDLRGNPGGLYDSVVACLDRFIEKDKLLVYTEDKYGKRESEYSKDDEQMDIPMAILVDGESASASEIFAICMQEYGKAKIVGTQSFGKGIVQSLYPIYFDQSAIKVTISRYYSPNGICIHGTGVTPDYVVELPEEQAKELVSLREKDDQLEKAIEVVKEK